MSTRIINGDSLEVLKTLESESVNTVITSPPYYGLRDYGIDGQIGLEETPDAYIQSMVEVFREVKRVLRDDGTVWLNIGDSYNMSGGNHKSWHKNDSGFQGKVGERCGGNGAKVKGLKPKDLIGIPWMLAFALRADGWYLRQDIIWHKPNPMPESVKDRCTKSHEYIFLLSKSPKYYYDYEAIKEPITESTKKLIGAKNTPRFGGNKYGDNDDPKHATKSGKHYIPTLKKNKRDVWMIATKPFKGAHFATFPEDLVIPCLLAGCPEGGTALDPFAGAGTVGVVCKKNNRNFIGIELNPEYAAMAQNRIENTPGKQMEIVL